MANYYCPISGGICTELCRFWKMQDKECLIESTLNNLSCAADFYVYDMERLEAERTKKGLTGGDTPNPSGKAQKGD